jgi:hypothetical protein
MRIQGGTVMKTRMMSLIALLATMLIGCGGAMAAPTEKTDPGCDLKMAMRKLWEDHIMYTRNYIISSLARLEDADKVAERLLKNQNDIGGAIKPYYGVGAGDRLATLLQDHIRIATQVVAAAKAGNRSALTDVQGKWTANSKEIAAFLSGADPNWRYVIIVRSTEDVETMLQKHLDLTTAEVVGRLNKDWAADMRAYDEGHGHMLMFADALTAGIVKQFPERFK